MAKDFDPEESLARQNSRMVNEFQAGKFKATAKKNWDLFYKRNENRFFKDRHWTTREFAELGGGSGILVEFGCGVGNFAFPLVEECPDLFIYACDFSPRAIQILKDHKQYDESRIVAFPFDVTSGRLDETPIERYSCDMASLMFVLSALPPEMFSTALKTVGMALKPGGRLLFRDYAVNDMAMYRFGPGTKMGDRHYVRQDGTMTYFFTKEEMTEMLKDAGFEVAALEFVQRRTVNKKEGIDVPRIFLQGKFVKK